jgi:excisionase family DNA binding protein
MTAAELATVDHVAALERKLVDLDAKLDRVLASLPSQWISLADAAERMGCDPRTITAAIVRGEIVGRRVGRRWLVDAASLRPAAAEQVSRFAREARR